MVTKRIDGLPVSAEFGLTIQLKLLIIDKLSLRKSTPVAPIITGEPIKGVELAC